MKVYIGIRDKAGSCVLVRDTEIDYVRTLNHVVRHSPSGMEWGYSGSGPADLALSILTDALGSVEKADPFYQAFKWRVIARLDRQGFELPLAAVLDWVQAVRLSQVGPPGPPAECSPQLN
ncbi:MAG: DUF6166 domain-containing protein [Bacillota bacterium]